MKEAGRLLVVVLSEIFTVAGFSLRRVRLMSVQRRMRTRHMVSCMVLSATGSVFGPIWPPMKQRLIQGGSYMTKKERHGGGVMCPGLNL